MTIKVIKNGTQVVFTDGAQLVQGLVDGYEVTIRNDLSYTMNYMINEYTSKNVVHKKHKIQIEDIFESVENYAENITFENVKEMNSVILPDLGEDITINVDHKKVSGKVVGVYMTPFKTSYTIINNDDGQRIQGEQSSKINLRGFIPKLIA